MSWTIKMCDIVTLLRNSYSGASVLKYTRLKEGDGKGGGRERGFHFCSNL